MRSGRKRALLRLQWRSLANWPGWWGRLLLCMGVVSLMLWLTLAADEVAGITGPAAAFGAVVVVLFVLLVGPPASRGRTEPFGLSRPVGRVEEVNRRGLLMTGVALSCCLVIGSIALVTAPELLRSRRVELSDVAWFHNSPHAFMGLDVAPRSEEEQDCLEKWSSLRWGGTGECNDLAREVFSSATGPTKKRFLFASAGERDCIAEWARQESAKSCFSKMLEEKAHAPPKPRVHWVVTGVSRYSFYRTACGDLAFDASTSPECRAFSSELTEASGEFSLYIADEPRAQPCFTHWQRALGRDPICWRPPDSVPVTIPPLGLLLIACFGVALFASAMLRTALAPAGPGRALTLAGAGLVLMVPVVFVFRGEGPGASAVLAGVCALAVGSYLVSLLRWKKGDFR